MQKPSLGWQSWSPPFSSWHGFPRWDYSPFPLRSLKTSSKKYNLRNPIRYWCSWYAYGWDITHDKIIATLAVIKKHQLAFTHILIDDGWTIWGDWHTPDPTRFSDISDTIKKIHTNKLKAGLWFAPFLASKKSELFKKHPDWFVSYRGRPVQGPKTMPIWESFLPKQYLLNLEIREVKKYITDFIDLAVEKWNVDLLKLDFLYAAYFNPSYKSDHVPHRQVAWLLSYIRNKHPHVITIACGAPFAPSLNLASAIRVSKDTALPPVVPSFINKLTYISRTKMLGQKLKAIDLPANIVLDPDVRMFSFDTTLTTSTWGTIITSIIGVGDNLSKLSTSKLKQLSLWLTNHNSR